VSELKKGSVDMNQSISENQRNELTKLQQANNLDGVRMFVPLSDPYVKKFIKRAKAVGLDVLGNEVLITYSTAKRVTGKEGILITDQYFHTMNGYSVNDGKFNMLYRVGFEMIKSATYDEAQRRLIIHAVSQSGALGSSQIQVQIEQPVADMIIKIVEIMQEKTSKKQSQQKAPETTIRCEGCGANTTSSDKYCGYCGKEVVKPKAESTTTSGIGNINDMLKTFSDRGFDTSGFDADNIVSTTSSQVTIKTNEKGETVVTRTEAEG